MAGQPANGFEAQRLDTLERRSGDPVTLRTVDFNEAHKPQATPRVVMREPGDTARPSHQKPVKDAITAIKEVSNESQ